MPHKFVLKEQYMTLYHKPGNDTDYRHDFP